MYIKIQVDEESFKTPYKNNGSISILSGSKI